VIRKPTKIHSRARARRALEAKRKGRHSGYGTWAHPKFWIPLMYNRLLFGIIIHNKLCTPVFYIAAVKYVAYVQHDAYMNYFKNIYHFIHPRLSAEDRSSQIC
jgi:hypothetical protein